MISTDRRSQAHGTATPSAQQIAPEIDAAQRACLSPCALTTRCGTMTRRLMLCTL